MSQYIPESFYEHHRRGIHEKRHGESRKLKARDKTKVRAFDKLPEEIVALVKPLISVDLTLQRPQATYQLALNYRSRNFERQLDLLHHRAPSGNARCRL
jgi:hypothetical protein